MKLASPVIATEKRAVTRKRSGTGAVLPIIPSPSECGGTRPMVEKALKKHRRRQPGPPFRINSHLMASVLFRAFKCTNTCYSSGMRMPIQSNDETFFTTQEAAEYLGFAEDTVRRYVYRKLIQAKKLGNMLLFSKEECDRYQREKRNPGRQKNSL